MTVKIVDETFYIGRDNTIDLLLLQDGAVVADLSGITRMVLKLGAVATIDSDTHPAALDWSGQDAQGRDKLVIDLNGRVTAETVQLADLIIYDGGNPNGIVWIASDSGGRDERRLRITAVQV